MTTGSELALTTAPDNVLPYPDQVLFLALRGAGAHRYGFCR